MHEKEDLQGINIRKDRKEKEGNYAVLSFGTEESTQAAIIEINKTTKHSKETSTNQSGEYVRSRECKRTEYGKPSSEAMLCMQGRRS